MARKSRKTVAVESMRDPDVKHHIVNLIGKEVRNEIRLMSSDSTKSFLRSKAKEDMEEFKWDRLYTELASTAPVLLSILNAATKTRVPRRNAHIIICTCAAILLKHRNPKMSLLQKIISIILYAGHTSKQV